LAFQQNSHKIIASGGARFHNAQQAASQGYRPCRAYEASRIPTKIFPPGIRRNAMQRREFLSQSAASAGALLVWQAAADHAQAAPNDRITIAMAGVKGRGGSVLKTFAGRPNVDVKYVCDIDETVLQNRVGEIASQTGKKPEAIKDFRKALDDKAVDALVLGTPDHWHALPSIMACQAGKDVYVEKPDGHNILEGLTMVAAAKKYKRVAQLGTQSRSGKHFLDAMDYLKTGAIGRPLFAKAWESGK
jgi:hypothetical protein